ncbi:unnamed protein product [Lepeophtheirus salmonis]|uniref:(salmon louse) hypothetical protein n=1 Tax=Lepeophtheirus salmonis TaxID=72036 RepID=A0A7R8H4M7_LEPSM|nr:unnamed protein product [Lepeophtheirus salmonis]CAF2861975.1 unnamed protein product [Lepeophtheirus salmonis]
MSSRNGSSMSGANNTPLGPRTGAAPSLGASGTGVPAGIVATGVSSPTSGSSLLNPSYLVGSGGSSSNVCKAVVPLGSMIGGEPELCPNERKRLATEAVEAARAAAAAAAAKVET